MHLPRFMLERYEADYCHSVTNTGMVLYNNQSCMLAVSYIELIMYNRSIDFIFLPTILSCHFFYIFLKVEPNDEHRLAPCRRTFLYILNSAYPTNAITIQNFPTRKCGDGDVPCERPVHFRIVTCVFITVVVGRIFDRECLNC